MRHNQTSSAPCAQEAVSAELLEPRVLLSAATFEDAIVLDAEFNRKGVTVVRTDIAEIGECDMFSFIARESGNQRIVLKDLNGSGFNGAFTVYDEDGQIVRQKDARGPADREIAQFPAELGELFFVEVGGSIGGETGDYRLRVKTEPGPVPDAVEDGATRIDSLFDQTDGTIALVEDTIEGRIHSRAYAFTARDDGVAGFILRTAAGSFTTNLDARMLIADDAGELLRIKNKRGPGGREEARLPVVAGEQYFVLISGVWGDEPEGDFRLRVKAPAGDPPAVEIGGISENDAELLDLVQTPTGLRLEAGPGLEMTVYDLADSPVTELPDFNTLTPHARTTIDTLDFALDSGDALDIGLTDNFAVVIQGLLRTDLPGRWNFRLDSDDGSRLYIDDQLIVDHDGVHEFTSAFGEIELAAGHHDIRVEYFEATGPAGLVLNVAAPGEDFSVLGPDRASREALLHDAALGNMLYAVTPDQAAGLALRLESINGSNGILGVYDSDGNLVEEADLQGQDQTETLATTVSAGERFFILTSDNAGVPNIEGRNRASIPTFAVNDDNRGEATATFDPAEPGWVRFTDAGAGDYTLSIEAGFVGRITVYDDAGRELTRSILADADGGPDEFAFSLDEPGGFIVAYDAALGDGMPGEATLVAQGPTQTIDGISVGDAIELSSGDSFDGTIAAPGERFLFTTTADFLLTTFGLRTFNTLAARMSIYDETDALLAFVDVGTDSFEDFLIVRPEGFRFYVVIDGGDTTGDFRFSIT